MRRQLGSKPSRVNPYAIEVMREIGIDINGHTDGNLVEVYARLTETELAEKPPDLEPTPLAEAR